VLVTPGIFLEVPGSFQAVILGEYDGYTTNEQATINGYPDSLFGEITGNSFDVIGLYKWKIPLSDPKNPRPLTFNNGCLVEIDTNGSTSYATGGGVYQTNTGNGSQVQVGVGLERVKDFTVGVQLDWASATDSYLLAGATTSYPDVNYTQDHFSVGGEKWISPNWALRMGIIFDDNNSHGYYAPNTGYYTLDGGEEITGVMVTPGIGYENKSFHLDGMLMFEEPTAVAPNTDSYTILGFQLETALLF
jgi:hypothetical protein